MRINEQEKFFSVFPLKLLFRIAISPFFLGWGLFGCGFSQPAPELQIQRSHEMKVSVYAEGREVKNFNNALVHRIDISEQSARSYKKLGESSLPFQATKERDNRGQAMGLRISHVRSGVGSVSFGLQDNDLVTAIGSKHAESSNDFDLLFQEILAEREASLTFERSGMPHKNLYYLTTAQSHDRESQQ